MKNRPIFKRLRCFLIAALLICSTAVMSPGVSAASPVWTNNFTDVPEGIWYENALAYMNHHGYINGISSDKFNPDGNTTRAMFVTILGRMEGIDDKGYADVYSFSDSAPDYAKGYIAWAYENDVVSGIGDNKFGADRYVTREQAATMFYNYFVNVRREEVNISGDLSRFSDSSKVSNFARGPMTWAVGEKIINGSGSNLLPDSNATRSQIAQIFVNAEIRKGNDTSMTILHPQPDVNRADVITVGGNDYSIGMSLPALNALAGKPDEILPSIYGYDWYVYGTDTYADFFMAGIANNKVVTLCSSGIGFSYMGKTMGDTGINFSDSAISRVDAMTDKNDGYMFHCILLTDKNYILKSIFTDEVLSAEARVDFHLVNAFRRYHNKRILLWSDEACTSATLHSQDMANNDYFKHINLDGLSPGDRMHNQGIQWRSCGENISGGYFGGVYAHECWVDSSDHRENMLTSSYRYLGVGFACVNGSTYRIYSTENFYG